MMDSTGKKLVCYLLLALAGYIMSMQDIPYEQVAKYHWWDWLMKIAGGATAVLIVWRGFMDQSISRGPSPPPEPPPTVPPVPAPEPPKTDVAPPAK